MAFDATIAQADLDEKKSQRDALHAAYELLIAPPRPEDRKALEIACSQAQASVARAQAALDRYSPLQQRGELSAAQVFESEQVLLQARLQQQSAEAQLALLQLGPKPAAIEEAKAKWSAAENLVALAQARLDQHAIRSPIDGVLDSLTCHPGQTIAPGTTIGEVVDTSQLQVVVWLPPPALAKIQVGQPARLDQRRVDWRRPERCQRRCQERD